jgi:dCMP deaminase
MYSTMRPCFGCTKEILQASVRAVYYLHDWVYPEAERQAGYEELQSFMPGGVNAVALADPEASWAVSTLRQDE